MSASRDIVVADIGGTHARFAIASIAGGGVVSLGDPVTLQTADHAGLPEAWQAFGEIAGQALPQAAAIAIAAPVRGETIAMTNNSWTLRPQDIGETLGLDAHVLVNDFAAVAHAVDAAGPEQFVHLAGPDQPLPRDGVVSVVGPGTGLGVALLVRAGGHSHVVATEGGHIHFAPLDRIEAAILAKLHAQYGRVSVERVVSGPGLRAMFETIAEIEGLPMPDGDDRSLWTHALAGDDPLAAAALERFCLCLAAVAGDIALAHGPGPVVIAGGIGRRLRDHLPLSGFAERFAAKGRYADLMRSLPVKLITHPEPGLFGAAHAFLKRYPD